MPEFYQTGYGRIFFEHQLPSLIRSLKDIADELKKANELKVKELEQNGEDKLTDF